MISKFSINEIKVLITSVSEQTAFDWKSDFVPPRDDEKRGEIIKDIVAIANASPLSYGFIVYGVDPRKPDPIIGITNPYDDSKLQQLLKSKVEPLPEFLYYEVSTGIKTVSVIQVSPSRKRPFIIAADIGKIRAGQIPIRRGSSTEGVKLSDLLEFFYGGTSVYFPNVIERLQVDVERQKAFNNYFQELRRGAEQAEMGIREIGGF
jgi:predicted HTH transcriptional regulator